MDKLIGSIGVDSGQVLIVDPAYVTDGAVYADICDVTLSDDRGGPVLLNAPKTDTLAVAHSTRDGDGTFPVYAEFDADGRLSALRIEFTTAATQCWDCSAEAADGEDYCESCLEDRDNNDSRTEAADEED